MDVEIDAQIPVIVGDNYMHFMCDARIVLEGTHLEVTMTADNEQALDLVTLLQNGEPMGLKFVPIPVTPRGAQ